MKIIFYKYQGTGNDFVMLDNRDGKYDSLTLEHIVSLCDRRFGIGADGLIRINSHETYDFEVDYFNSDGTKSFCGNGARCAVAFAETLGIDVSLAVFMAIDGVHEARKVEDIVHLRMNNVDQVECGEENCTANTGSPHYIIFVDDVKKEDVLAKGQSVRFSEKYQKEGINVNLIETVGDHSIRIRTYERGVEDETLSCGTGATACALAFAELNGWLGEHLVEVGVEGGDLKVALQRLESGEFVNIELIGPAKFVFKGEMDV